MSVRATNRGIDLQRQSLDVADKTLKTLRLPNGSTRRINKDRKVALPALEGGSTLSVDLCG